MQNIFVYIIFVCICLADLNLVDPIIDTIDVVDAMPIIMLDTIIPLDGMVYIYYSYRLYE